MSGSWRRMPLPPNWGQIRAFVLSRDPQCMWGSLPEDMANPGLCPNRSTDADHTGEPWDHRPEALRGLCTNHHATRTGRQGAAGAARVLRSRKRPKEQHPGYINEPACPSCAGSIRQGPEPWCQRKDQHIGV